MTHLLLTALCACLWLGGCATKRLPPGTPPPEYETRAVPPWPPVTSAPSAPAPVPTAPEGSPDAGSGPDGASSEPSPSPDAGSE